ncbi:MAG: pentapeptide repeat-containing protein [Rhodocyclaceae bacterium]|nr:pentapeptide repeat-containing protein [Rhodocyclaceae bacterium]
MFESSKLEAIVKSRSKDPRILAELAGGDPRSFYRGANFDNTDLRGVDLRGYNLTAATFENARLDRNTKVDDAYISVVGLQRTTIIIPYLSFSPDGVLVKLHEVAGRDHLGDIVDEIIRSLEVKVGNLEKFLSENLTDKWSKLGIGGRLVFDESNWMFIGHSMFPPTMTDIDSGKTKSIFSFLYRDMMKKKISQSPVNLFYSDKDVSSLNDTYEAKKNESWNPIIELMNSKATVEKKNLEVALLLSTHKKLVALTGVTKADLATLTAQFLQLFSKNTYSKKGIERIMKRLEAITS